jgi:hypothetical protein
LQFLKCEAAPFIVIVGRAICTVLVVSGVAVVIARVTR